jgi:alpha-N-arabinofuranosidase
VHQDATLLPISFTSNKYQYNNREIDAVSVSASKDASGKIHITLVNIDPNNEQQINVQLIGASVKKVSGQILTSEKINDYNTFEQPDKVSVATFKGASLKGNDNLSVTLPSKSVVMLELQ